MNQGANQPDESPDFSLVLGGPLYRLWLRSRLGRRPLDLVRRRIVVITLIAWLPLLLISLFGGHVAGGAVPFLRDIEAQVRFLVALPILIGVEVSVHERLRVAVKQFVERGIVTPDKVPRFNAAIKSVRRLCDSSMIETGLLVFVYTVGHWLWREHVALDRTSWYAIIGDSGLRLTPVGWWYAFVSIPIFQFLLLRWCLRLLLWFWFLWRVSRLDLNLSPIHPDRAGGIGFLGNSAYAFGPILFAEGAMLAGLIANRIFYEGQTLMAFKVDIVVLVVFLVGLILGPLAVFAPPLFQAKLQGRREYGLLASRHSQEFDRKWIRGGVPAGQTFLGNADISSWADLDSGYAAMCKMRPVPFDMDVVVQLVIITVAPLLPLTLTVLPFDKMIEHLIKALL